MKPLNILLADDTKSVGHFVSEYLREAGHQVTYVQSGEEAVEAYKQQPFDLVLMDVQMPVMDGLALYHTLQVSPTLQSIPMILMSAVASFNSQIRGNSNTQLITKPFDLDMLLATIDRYLAQQ